MGDQGDRKTVRAFQCRDYLFEIFDRMSSDRQCSVDYLINEAMREYARAREQTVAALDAQEMRGSAMGGGGSMAAPQRDPRLVVTRAAGRRPHRGKEAWMRDDADGWKLADQSRW